MEWSANGPPKVQKENQKRGVTICDKLYAIKDDATGYLKSEREMLAKKSVLTLGTSKSCDQKERGRRVETMVARDCRRSVH